MRAILLLFFLAIPILCSFNNPLSHCTEQKTVIGERSLAYTSKRSVTFGLGKNQAACLQTDSNNTSTLHSFTLIRFEHHHPVLTSYRFAVPLITSDCLCECPYGRGYCNREEYEYRNCSSGSVCYRTYRRLESGEGCETEGDSTVCCEIRIDPYKDQKFTAVQLGQPTAFVVLKYRSFEKQEGREWHATGNCTFTVPFNTGITVSSETLSIAANGQAPSQALPASELYFIEDGQSELRGGVTINDVHEWNLQKLGWFRTNGTETVETGGLFGWLTRWIEKDRWTIRNGLIKMTEAHNLSVLNCKEQRFVNTFNADHFVMNDDEKEVKNVSYGHPLADLDWVESATYDEKRVRVKYAEDLNAQIRIVIKEKKDQPEDNSTLGWFEGEITTDELGARILNITFHRSSGTLLCYVYETESRGSSEYSFSVTIGVEVKPYTIAANLNSSINGPRFVCLRPVNDAHKKKERCKWLPYNSSTST